MGKSRLFYQKIYFILLFATIHICSIAHPVGHYDNNYTFNTWTLKSGKSIQGNFLFNKGDTVFLEQTQGKNIKIHLKDLSDQDRLLASFKIKKLQTINQALVTQESIERSNLFNYNTSKTELIVWGLLLCCICVLIVFRKIYFHLKISFAAAIALFGVVAFRDKYPLPKTDPLFIDSSFAMNKPRVNTSWDEHFFYVESNGIPEHPMMEGITSWQQQVPLPQHYTKNNHWTIPLQPEYATHPVSLQQNFMRGAIAIAVNGIPIFNALNNRGEDSYTIGELDKWGGHCGKGDDYHYHIAPTHLSNNKILKPIAFALDGFPMYGDYEPDGNPMQKLDSCHGHEDLAGNYHYHGANTYPYTIGYMRGKVACDESKPAPENQIKPQAVAQPVRPPGRPLRGASIIGLTMLTPNDYSLKYQLGNKYGFINYTWDNANFYFTYIDIDGNTTKNTYRRRP